MKNENLKIIKKENEKKYIELKMHTSIKWLTYSIGKWLGKRRKSTKSINEKQIINVKLWK